VFWRTGRLPRDAPIDLSDAVDFVRLGATLGWADLQAMPQAVLDYLPMVSVTLAEYRAREAKRNTR
jgi:hypothetical protein